MSLLDTIKNLFCKNSCEKSEPKQENKASAAVEKKAAPKAEQVSEVKPKTEQAPGAKPKAEAKVEPKAKAEPKKVVKSAKLQVPEDSALKRHFLTTLKAEIESGMPPRPKDATSGREHDKTVQAELEKRIA